MYSTHPPMPPNVENEFGQSSQAVHGSQQLVKMAAVYLLVEWKKLAGTYDATELRISVRTFNNKVRGLNTDVEIPDSDVRKFSTEAADGEELLQKACGAAGTAFYVRALSRSIIPTLESEFPTEVKLYLSRLIINPLIMSVYYSYQEQYTIRILCSLRIIFFERIMPEW